MHGFDLGALYAADWVDSAYGGEALRQRFEAIVALDAARSDNAGRVASVVAHARRQPFAHHGDAPTVLDVGSGLCVFLHGLKREGWRCTALDPDPRAIQHARDVVGVAGVCGDYLRTGGLGPFDVITFNKVLEHVADPVTMLAKSRGEIGAGGFVYVEVPDGERAIALGPEREEFFVDHLHVFSAASLSLTVTAAGFTLRRMERLVEPSGKYTLRAFLEPASDMAPT